MGEHRVVCPFELTPTFGVDAPQPLFGSVLGVAHHVALMDTVWKCHLLGQAHGLRSRAPREERSVAQVAELQFELDAWFVNYACSLQFDEDEPIEFEFIGGGRSRMRPSEILMHVVNHGTYHRGHISAFLHVRGLPAPASDFPVFLRECPSASVDLNR